MSLNWDFNTDKMGYILYKDGTRKPMYNGNAFVIINNEWEENGERYYSLYNFYADETHAKRCLGLDSKYKDTYKKAPSFADPIWRDVDGKTVTAIQVDKVVLYSKARNAKELASMLIKAYNDITIELKSNEE